MERLTYFRGGTWWINLCGHEYGGFPEIDRLTAYEDTGITPEYIAGALKTLDMFADATKGVPLNRVRELVEAEKDGRLVVLPCKESTVYTIEEDYFNCAECRHRDSAYYQEQIKRVSCDMDIGFRCPFYIKEHEVTGFEIMFDKTGNVVLSGPGEFGYEGLEQFTGIDSKVYYTREEAEAALKKRREADNAAD